MDYPTRARVQVMRWLPLPMLALAAAGPALQSTGSDEGVFVATSALLLSVAVGGAWNPLRLPTRRDPFDGREARILRAAAATGAAAAGLVALLGAALVFGGLDLWAPTAFDDWAVLGCALLALAHNVFLLRAAWLVPIDGYCRA